MLEAPGTVSGDAFGSSVAISGTTAVVGAGVAGRAYVFTKAAEVWRQVAKLNGSDTRLSDEFGSSVAISGTTVVVGAQYHANHAGRAYVFAKSAAGWHQVAELKDSDNTGTDEFGYSVAISGAIVVVGAPYHTSAGRAYVFIKTAKGWKQAAELRGSDNLAHDNYFGSSVAVSGSTALVGAPDHAKAGRAYLFEA